MSRIIGVRSGGQSGADRGAMDAAQRLGVDVCGWCPAGGWAEDFPDPPGVRALYPQMKETPSADVEQRTEWNIRDSSCCIVLNTRARGDSPGTDIGYAYYETYGVPHFEIQIDDPSTIDDQIGRAAEWIHGLEDDAIVLGVGGPRASEYPGIYDMASRVVEVLLAEFAQDSPAAPGAGQALEAEAAGAGAAEADAPEADKAGARVANARFSTPEEPCAWPATTVIGIAGGSGSGKTTFANRLCSRLAPNALVLSHDNYYKHRPEMTPEEAYIFDFDSPEALDTHLLVEHVRSLKAGRAVDIPSYNFITHARTEAAQHIEPVPYVIVEGLLILADPDLRNLFDLLVYIDVDADVRAMRRIQRDCTERGASLERAIAMYLATTKRAHDTYVEPFKSTADIVITDARNETALEIVARALLP